MSDLVAALLDAAWRMAERGEDRYAIAKACGIDVATASDVIARYKTYAGDVRAGLVRNHPVATEVR